MGPSQPEFSPEVFCTQWLVNSANQSSLSIGKFLNRLHLNSLLLRGPTEFSGSMDFMTAAWMQLCLFQSGAKRQNAT